MEIFYIQQYGRIVLKNKDLINLADNVVGDMCFLQIELNYKWN